jgi:hypothetical protein
MNLFESLANIIHDLLVFIGAMAVLSVATLIAIARLPADNPLRRILYALSLRVGITVGAGVVAMPAQSIPGVDVAYDVAVPTALIYFWVTLIREVLAILKDSRRAAITSPVEPQHPAGPGVQVIVTQPRLSKRAEGESPRLSR